MALRLTRDVAVLPSGRRGVRFALVVLGVAAVHGCVTREMSLRLADLALEARMPHRISVAYVRTLEPEPPPSQAPVAAVPPPSRAPRVGGRRVAAPAKAASAVARVPKALADTPPEVLPPPAAEVSSSMASAEDPRTQPEAPSLADAPAAAASTPSAADLTTAPPATVASADAAASASGSAGAASAPERAATLGDAAPGAEAAMAAASAASAPAGAEPFDWPASTRVSFILTGNYRGEVKGNAQVEWIRIGSHYQVNLDLLVGPDFAPLITRRMSSEGELTTDGLTPSRYDEDTQVVLRERRRVAIYFQPEGVVLANGERRERWRGMQDTASQFVQLTWLFTTKPELLRVGGQVEVPLALPKGTDRWTYDVLDEVVIQTPFGPLPTFHLKPRRAKPRPGELTAEIWFAPSLRYLPVRIRIEQDPQTYLDLVIAKKPELAAK